jgi:hypothetical protein
MMVSEAVRLRAARRVLICLAAVSIAGAATIADAQTAAPKDPRAAQPERPTVATHAFAVAPGIIELEAGASRQTLGESASVFGVPAVLKIGLGPRVQLDVAPGYLRLLEGGTATAGLTDLGVAVKWHVFDDAPVLGAFAIQPGFSVATGSVEAGTGIGTGSVSVLLISSHSIGPVALDVNGSYTHRGADGTVVPNDATMWTVAAGFPVVGRLGWCAELFGYPRTYGPSGEEGIIGFLTGPSFTINRSLIADMGVVLDVANLGGTQVYAGVTWNMGHAWKPR